MAGGIEPSVWSLGKHAPHASYKDFTHFRQEREDPMKHERNTRAFTPFAIGIAISLILTGTASAQTVGVGTTKGGATAAVAATIAKVVSTNSDVQMRTQPMAGTQQYIPLVNAGEMNFGVSNVVQATMAIHGSGLSQGHKYESLQMVSTLMTFRFAPVVPIKSGIKTVADLRGKEYPTGFKASPLFGLVMEGFLLNSGVSLNDIKKVPVVAVRQHWDFLKQGKIVAATGVVGSGIVKELNASVSGGIRFLSMERSPAGLTRVSKILPGIEILPVKPNPHFVGIEGPINVLAYDYMLWTHKGMNSDTVYKVVKALYENEKTLHQASPIWRSHRSARMAKNHGLTYHPAAQKFYQEVGVWKR